MLLISCLGHLLVLEHFLKFCQNELAKSISVNLPECLSLLEGPSLLLLVLLLPPLQRGQFFLLPLCLELLLDGFLLEPFLLAVRLEHLLSQAHELFLLELSLLLDAVRVFLDLFVQLHFLGFDLAQLGF